MNSTHHDARRRSTNRPPTRQLGDPTAQFANPTTEIDDPTTLFANPTHQPSTTSDGVGTAGASREGTENDQGPDPGSPADTAGFAWLAVLPALATLAGVAVGFHVGFDVFDPGRAGTHRLVAYALLVPYFLLGVAGTRWLLEDATRLAEENADWQPTPLYYVGGGGLLVECYFVAPLLAGRGPQTDVVQYLFGGLVVSLLLSSVVAGPVYLLQRRRRLGE